MNVEEFAAKLERVLPQDAAREVATLVRQQLEWERRLMIKQFKREGWQSNALVACGVLLVVGVFWNLWQNERRLNGGRYYVAPGVEEIKLQAGDVVMQLSDRAPDCISRNCKCEDFEYRWGKRDLEILVAMHESGHVGGLRLPVDRDNDGNRCE